MYKIWFTPIYIYIVENIRTIFLFIFFQFLYLILKLEYGVIQMITVEEEIKDQKRQWVYWVVFCQAFSQGHGVYICSFWHQSNIRCLFGFAPFGSGTGHLKGRYLGHSYRKRTIYQISFLFLFFFFWVFKEKGIGKRKYLVFISLLFIYLSTSYLLTSIMYLLTNKI